MINGLLLVIPPLVLSTLMEVPTIRKMADNDNSLICALLAFAILSLPIWFFVMAWREEQLQQAEDDCNRQVRSNKRSERE